MCWGALGVIKPVMYLENASAHHFICVLLSLWWFRLPLLCKAAFTTLLKSLCIAGCPTSSVMLPSVIHKFAAKAKHYLPVLYERKDLSCPYSLPGLKCCMFLYFENPLGTKCDPCRAGTVILHQVIMLIPWILNKVEMRLLLRRVNLFSWDKGFCSLQQSVCFLNNLQHRLEIKEVSSVDR